MADSLEERVEALEAEIKRITDLERAGKIVWRIVLYLGALGLGVSTFWFNLHEIFKKALHG